MTQNLENTPLTSGENGSLADGSKPTKPEDVVKGVQIKSDDGKLHNLFYNETKNKLTFSLVGNKCRELTISYSEILSIRQTPVKIYGGLPKKIYPDEHNKKHPNALYIYYTYRQNIYLWRIREAAIFFLTTREKEQWEALLKKPLSELSERPKNIIVFINPYGGKGKAKQIYDKQVEPILELVGVNREVILTQRADHARDTIKELGIDSWGSIDGVVSVGGDGLFNEVLYSSIIRTQSENGKDINDVNVDKLVTPRFRFGIIGAGSANSIVSSVHGVDDCPTAAVHIAIGSCCAVDVCTVHEGLTLSRISANAISYGWLGDVLHDSERYRFMGPVRYQWSALRTTVRHPTYYGRVSFAVTEKSDEKVQLPQCRSPCSICQGREQPDPNLPYHWQTDFTHCICCVIPCVSPFTPYGLAPYAGVGDGTMDLALVPKVTRCQNLQIMRTVSMYGGKELLPRGLNLKVYRVKRWSYTPAALLNPGEQKDENDIKQGAWNLDGEILPQPADKTLHFRLHPMLIRYFGRELDLDDPRYQKCHCCHCPTKYSRLVVIG
uniref:DAGKc domain-containing protein n=1 Tax=Bursaphelenchus xylophilus TaxID=6326 RepID=A0A1I7SAB0_BURXY